MNDMVRSRIGWLILSCLFILLGCNVTLLWLYYNKTKNKEMSNIAYERFRASFVGKSFVQQPQSGNKVSLRLGECAFHVTEIMRDGEPGLLALRVWSEPTTDHDGEKSLSVKIAVDEIFKDRTSRFFLQDGMAMNFSPVKKAVHGRGDALEILRLRDKYSNPLVVGISFNSTRHPVVVDLLAFESERAFFARREISTEDFIEIEKSYQIREYFKFMVDLYPEE